jgi:Type II secretion system (T2SS), protein M
MTARDRIVVFTLAALAVLAATWLLLVSPEREQAGKLGAQVSAAQSQLASAESQVAAARSAQAGYETDYASLVSLGKAVPINQEVPSLIYELAHATHQKQVEFSSITTGGSSASSAASSSAPAGAAFTAMPFTFVFNGSFFNLYDLFQQLDRSTLSTSSGDLQVSGRLLTIQSVNLAPVGTSSEPGSDGRLTGTITATAYVLPAGQGLTGGATATSPTGATQTTSDTGSSSSTSAPAAVIGASR